VVKIALLRSLAIPRPRAVPHERADDQEPVPRRPTYACAGWAHDEPARGCV